MIGMGAADVCEGTPKGLGAAQELCCRTQEKRRTEDLG